MSGQTFSAGQRAVASPFTNIQYQNETGISNAATTAGSDTTTSATYVNLAGTGSVTSFSFTKVLAATNLKVAISASWVAATNSANTRFAVLVNGVDYECCGGLAGTGAGYMTYGWQYIPGLAAGVYTIQGRWKRFAGTGTPTRDTNSWLSISVAECT